MAVDDVTIVLSVNLGAAATADRQPASGVEEMLLHLGNAVTDGSAPDATPDIIVYRIDGTNNDAILLSGDSGDMATLWFRTKMIADNTNYFRFRNTGAQADCTWAMIVAG